MSKNSKQTDESQTEKRESKLLDWYFPNPAYVPDIDQLEEREKIWIERWQ